LELEAVINFKPIVVLKKYISQLLVLVLEPLGAEKGE
jgi:hypothetical protein